jgi:hypothetical protein
MFKKMLAWFFGTDTEESQAQDVFFCVNCEHRQACRCFTDEEAFCEHFLD